MLQRRLRRIIKMISVVIPLYNKEPIIEKSLRSVLSQDYDDFEVVVVNDGSTDRSAEIVKGIDDPHIRLIEQENGGPSKARNTGVKNAQGEWIVFLDADDEFLSGALSYFDSLIRNHLVNDFFACPFYIFDGQKQQLFLQYQEGELKNPYKASFKGQFLPRTGAFVCKKDLMLSNLFNEQIRRFEDLEMLYRLYHDVKIYLGSKPVMIVNQDFAAASHGRSDIKEDFVGYIDFKGKTFWEKMCLYKLYLGERPYYKEQCKKNYPCLDKRFDLLILSKLLSL